MATGVDKNDAYRAEIMFLQKKIAEFKEEGL